MTDQNTQPGAGGADPNAQAGANPNAQTWYSGIENPDVRGFIETKGWKDPGAVVESYRQLETTIGVPADRIIKLPAKPEDPGWKEARARVGFSVPDKAEDYGLPVPEGIDPGYAAKVSAKALELGIPKQMLVGLAEWQNNEMAAMIQADQLAAQQQSEADMTTLRAEWGEQFDNSSELARRAVKEFGGFAKLDESSLNAMEGAMGTASFLKMWAAIGSKMGEGKFVDAGDHSTNAAMSPDGAQARINQLMGDKAWFERWNAGGAAERAEWDRLNRIAAGAKT